MGIRETLNQNPRLTTILTISIIVIVLGFLCWQIWGGSSQGQAVGSPGQKYFSDDDGKTYYADDAKKVPPYQHNGKDAVEAIVIKCDGKTFINHLRRYTPEGKKRMEAVLNAPGASDAAGAQNIETEIEEKLPGQKDWLKVTDPKAAEIHKPRCTKLDEMEYLHP